MNKRIFWILIFMFLFVSSAFCAPGHSRNVRANNNGTNGQILINTGQDSGKTDIGSWTDIDSFGFVSSDDLTKEIKERIDEVNNRVSKLERTQFKVQTEFRIIDTKTFSVSPYVSSNFTRNCVDEADLRIVFKIGKSYEEREIDKLREKIRQKEDEEISNRATIAEMNSRLNYLMKKVK